MKNVYRLLESSTRLTKMMKNYEPVVTISWSTNRKVWYGEIFWAMFATLAEDMRI